MDFFYTIFSLIVVGSMSFRFVRELKNGKNSGKIIWYGLEILSLAYMFAKLG